MNSVYTDFRELLESEPIEEMLHQFLASHTFVLRDLGYGVKRVFSKPAFGSDFKADFALAGWGNYLVWTFVEIEASHHKLFTKNGLLSQGLNKAIEQVNSWWVWMYDYAEYAKDHFDALSGDKTAAIVIGRRKSLNETDTKRLQHLNATQLGGRLRIMTYDSLLDHVEPLSQNKIDDLAEVHSRLTEYPTVTKWMDSGSG